MMCPQCGHDDGGTRNQVAAWLRELLRLRPKAARCAFEDEASGDIGGGPACDCRNVAHSL